MTYALDTNIVIRYLRHDPDVRRKLHDSVMSGDDLIIPKIVHYEIKRGFRILHAPSKEKAYGIFVGLDGCCDIAEIDEPSWERAESVYAALYRKGLTIGELDILIAAFCLDKGYTLITNNTKHFEVVDGLSIEDWSAK